jgi:serine protease Do
VVRLADHSEHGARLVGQDQRTDIALLKIEASGLPTLSFGDSDRLQVGEPVMAIGNPFGLEQSVTTGIVSAKERFIGAGPYDDFIQTDASINPGNSGGPLVDSRGALVGINTAIFSQTGGSVGIGFAIPVSIAKDVLPHLRAGGKVVRGYLGVAVMPVSPQVQRRLGLPAPRGPGSRGRPALPGGRLGHRRGRRDHGRPGLHDPEPDRPDAKGGPHASRHHGEAASRGAVGRAHAVGGPGPSA